MQHSDTPRRCRVFDGFEDEKIVYTHGCFFPATDILVWDDGEEQEVSNEEFEWPKGIEWLDEDFREDLEMHVYLLTDKLEALAKHVNYEPEPYVCDKCQEKLDEKNNHPENYTPPALFKEGGYGPNT